MPVLWLRDVKNWLLGKTPDARKDRRWEEKGMTEDEMVGQHQFSSVQFSSVTQSCPTLLDPMNRSTPGLPVHHQFLELIPTHVHRVVMPSNHLILCHPLLLPPSIFPSIRGFSNHSILPIRLPKYWSFSFNISASSEYSGLISFRMDWLDLLVVQGTL